MKKISSLLVFGLALLLSCEKEGPTTVNEITDLYTAPAGAKEMTFTGGESTWSTDRRYFDLKFSDLTTTLVGYDAFLAPGLYMLGGDEIGKAIAAKTKVGGQTPSEGWITVNNRDGKYQFTAQFGDQVYFWAGSLPFQADPAPLDLTVLQQASANKDSKLVTLQLATEGISQGYDENWQQVWTGEGKYLAIDLYSEDGYLHDGLYRASAQGGVVNAGEFGIGYDTVVDWGWGPMEMKDWGTCLWTVSGGKATAEKITSGLVSVTSREEKVDDKDVTIWTILSRPSPNRRDRMDLSLSTTRTRLVIRWIAPRRPVMSLPVSRSILSTSSMLPVSKLLIWSSSWLRVPRTSNPVTMSPPSTPTRRASLPTVTLWTSATGARSPAVPGM